jgi:SPP1 family predicted phage head-tail adaptor
MNTGKLNRRITIVSPGTMTPTTIGGFTEGTKTQRNTWCSARQLSMYERLTHGLEESNAAYIFSFLYDSVKSITNKYELIYEGRTFRIVSILEMNEEKREVSIIANERIN